MTTIVNTPAPATDSSGNGGMIVGIFAVIVLSLLFVYFGLPAIRSIGTPQVTIPAKIDVTVKPATN